MAVFLLTATSLYGMKGACKREARLPRSPGLRAQVQQHIYRVGVSGGASLTLLSYLGWFPDPAVSGTQVCSGPRYTRARGVPGTRICRVQAMGRTRVHPIRLETFLGRDEQHLASRSL